MPDYRKCRQGVGAVPPALALISFVLLAGCVNDGVAASRSAGDAVSEPAAGQLEASRPKAKGTPDLELLVVCGNASRSCPRAVPLPG